MRNIVPILDIPIDALTMSQAVDTLQNSINSEKNIVVYTPNAEILALAYRDEDLKSSLIGADMLTADGFGVVLASRLLGSPLPERVSGFDLMHNLLEKADLFNQKVFLLGAAPGVAEQAKINIINKYPGVEIVGVENGYGYLENEDEILEKINNSAPDILFVALGAPKQEKWIHKNKEKINAKVCIGVGGCFDIIAGKKKRAPEFFQKSGLEWLYRLLKEPWRFKRMLNLPIFLMLVLRDKSKH